MRVCVCVCVCARVCVCVCAISLVSFPHENGYCIASLYRREGGIIRTGRAGDCAENLP